jgi:hypothetical protein
LSIIPGAARNLIVAGFIGTGDFSPAFETTTA